MVIRKSTVVDLIISQKPAEDAPGEEASLGTSSSMADGAHPVPPGKASRQQATRKMLHELRNPLGGILAASQFLIEDAGPVLSDHHLNMVLGIEASGIRLLRLIDDYLKTTSDRPASKKKSSNRLRDNNREAKRPRQRGTAR